MLLKVVERISCTGVQFEQVCEQLSLFDCIVKSSVRVFSIREHTLRH